MPWRAEDLLNAVLEEEDSGAGSQATSDDPIAQRVHRYLDRADGGLLTVRLGDVDRTYTFPTIGQPTRPAAWPDTPPIEVLNHELLVCIGMGGFGQVWLARHELTEHHRACKLIPASMSVELDGLRRLKQRVPAHPNLFPIEEVGRAGDWIYCLMPLADSGTDAGTASGVDAATKVTLYRPLSLRQHLQDRGRVNGAEAARIAADLLEGLAHLHAHGVTHGDIKPGNILRLSGRWTLSDYGLVQVMGTDLVHGHTPGFIPPEGPGGKAADLYAAGIVIALLASDTPFQPKNVDVLEANIDRLHRPWRRTVRLLCHRDPEVRVSRASVCTRSARQRASGGIGRKWLAVLALGALGITAWNIYDRTMRESLVPLAPETIESKILSKMNDLGYYTVIDYDVISSRTEDGTYAASAWFDTQSADVQAHTDSFWIHRPAIASDGPHTAAISQDGKVLIWGRGGDPGFLKKRRGDPTSAPDWVRMSDAVMRIPPDIRDPVRIAVMGGVVAVVQSDGRLIVWGLDDHGLVSLVPDDLGPVIDVCILWQGTIIVSLADGTVRGWGKNWTCERGQLGPLDFPANLRDVERLSATNAHWIYRTFDGRVGGAGCNLSAQISFTSIQHPVIEVRAAESWSAVLDASGTIYTFGFRTQESWLQAPVGDGFITMATGHYHGLALHKSGRVVTWGDNRSRQGVMPSGLSEVVGLFAASQHAGAIHRDGSLTLWGDNTQSQLVQPAGLRIRLGDPDLNQNGIADWIDILRGEALDENRNGIPDHSEETAS